MWITLLALTEEQVRSNPATDGYGVVNWNIVLLAIIAAIQAMFIAAIPLIVLFVNRNRAEDKRRTDAMAEKVEEVKTATAEHQKVQTTKLDCLQQAQNKVVHQLDGQRSAMLRTIAAAMRALANAYPSDRGAAAVADKAESDLKEHEEEMAKADAIAAKTPPPKVE